MPLNHLGQERPAGQDAAEAAAGRACRASEATAIAAATACQSLQHAAAAALQKSRRRCCCDAPAQTAAAAAYTTAAAADTAARTGAAARTSAAGTAAAVAGRPPVGTAALRGSMQNFRSGSVAAEPASAAAAAADPAAADLAAAGSAATAAATARPARQRRLPVMPFAAAQAEWAQSQARGRCQAVVAATCFLSTAGSAVAGRINLRMDARESPCSAQDAVLLSSCARDQHSAFEPFVSCCLATNYHEASPARLTYVKLMLFGSRARARLARFHQLMLAQFINDSAGLRQAGRRAWLGDQEPAAHQVRHIFCVNVHHDKLLASPTCCLCRPHALPHTPRQPLLTLSLAMLNAERTAMHTAACSMPQGVDAELYEDTSTCWPIAAGCKLCSRCWPAAAIRNQVRENACAGRKLANLLTKNIMASARRTYGGKLQLELFMQTAPWLPSNAAMHTASESFIDRHYGLLTSASTA